MQRSQRPWPLHLLGLNLQLSVWVAVHAGKNWMECSNHLINCVQIIACSCLHELCTFVQRIQLIPSVMYPLLSKLTLGKDRALYHCRWQIRRQAQSLQNWGRMELRLRRGLSLACGVMCLVGSSCLQLFA